MTDACRIYAVDDDALVLKSLCALLGSHDYEVQPFVSAEAFLESADLNAIGCVISDLRMPGICGEQLQAHLASVGSSLTVVVVTGHADHPTTSDLIRNGAVTVLEKPYLSADLLAAVDQAVSRSRESFSRRGQPIDG